MILIENQCLGRMMFIGVFKNNYCLLEDVVYTSETKENSYTWPSNKYFGKYFDKG